MLAHDTGDYVKQQHADHQQRRGAPNDLLGLGAALAIDLVDVHGERLAGAEHVPGASGARQVKAQEVQPHRRAHARGKEQCRGLAKDAAGRKHDAGHDGGHGLGDQDVQCGLPASEAHGQARIALGLRHVLERLLNHAHQDGDVEHGERDGAGDDGVLPAQLHREYQESEHADDNGRQRGQRLDGGGSDVADGAVRRVLNQKDRAAQADGHRDDQSDQQQIERVEQLVEYAALSSVGARGLREEARLEQRRDTLEQDIGHHGNDDEHDDGGDRRQHARGDAVLFLDTPESRLVDVDVRASHEPSPPCGQ